MSHVAERGTSIMRTVKGLLLLLLLGGILSFYDQTMVNGMVKEKEQMQKENKTFLAYQEEVVSEEIVYDGLTLTELSRKLDRSLSSDVSGYGSLFASYSLEKDVDPYLAVAIMLHETGCKWNCSTLVKACNNVGGQKGSPGCGGGSYKRFPTLEDGIKGFIDNLQKNYVAYGLTTPSLMASKYASSPTWAIKVENYMLEIKSK